MRGEGESALLPICVSSAVCWAGTLVLKYHKPVIGIRVAPGAKGNNPIIKMAGMGWEPTSEVSPWSGKAYEIII